MRTIHVDTIVENIKEMCIEANHFLSSDMKEALDAATIQEEAPLGRQILNQLQENLQIAGEDMIPICQDTGMAVIFMEIGQEMNQKGLKYSDTALTEIQGMCKEVLSMFAVSRNAFETADHSLLPELTAYENRVDDMKKELTAKHYARLADGSCSVTHSPYYTSTVAGLERVADHLVNVGYSISNPTGSQSEHL